MADLAAPPRRRLKMTLELHADTAKDISDALYDLSIEIEATLGQLTGGQYRSASGGSTSGWTVDVDIDGSITHESYLTELGKWRGARNGIGGPGQDGGEGGSGGS